MVADDGEDGELLGFEMPDPINMSAIEEILGPENTAQLSGIIHTGADQFVTREAA